MNRKLIILAYYINISGLSQHDSEMMIHDIRKSYEMSIYPKDIEDKYHIVMLFVPNRRDTKIELIYPQRIQIGEEDAKQIDNFEDVIEELNKMKK